MATEVRLFGSFEIRLTGGAKVNLSSQKDRALLAILAVQPGVMHSRGKLTGLLWSERADAQARDSLKHSLARVRDCLGRSSQEAIISDRQSVAIDPSAVTVDAATFEKLLRSGTDAEVGQASDLYRGDFLEGLNVRDPAFEDWLLVERRRLRESIEVALTRLLKQLMASGNHDPAVVTARRLMSLDPMNEAACRALMRIYTERSEATQALRIYEILRERLHHDLGVKPEPETIKLLESIRQSRNVEASPASSKVDTHGAAGLMHADERGNPSRPSIAVLAFRNLSDDPAQEYFADGITEEIITELSRFRSLFVIARNSSFVFKSKTVKIQDIGRELGVAYIVEGSIRRDVARIRINAQLIEATTGNHLWAERFDRDVHDIFTLQDEVARTIASTVSGKVESEGRNRVERLTPNALQAYDLILRSKALMAKYNKGDNEQALACAQRAIELDPAGARGHAHAAWCHLYDYMAGWTPDRKISLAEAYASVRRAVTLDEFDSFPHSILGFIHLLRREYDEACLETEKAIDLNPNDHEARRFRGEYLAAVGRPDAAIEQIDIAKRLDPFDTRWVPWIMGAACFIARRYDEAITALKQARDPINEVRGWLAASYAQAGRLQDARATLEEFLQVAQSDMAVFPGRRLRDWEPYWHGAFEFQDQKDFDHLFEALRKAGLS
jgi:TolB-like protein/Flp pilus assembly protein TadD